MIKWTVKDVDDRMQKILTPQNGTGNANLVEQLKAKAQEMRQVPKGQRYPIQGK